MVLTKENRKELIGQYSRKEGDTGSPEVQIALLTGKIKYLTEHFKVNKKDHHSRKGLIAMIEQRKKLLKYLRVNDMDRYKDIISKLKLRK